MPPDPSKPSPAIVGGDLPDRQFAWRDMFVHPDDDPRSDGPGESSERAVLTGYLNDQRLTLQLKCADLDAEQLARRSVPPSDLSLLGLIRHLAGVEHVWMQARMAGEKVSRLYRSESGDDEFSGAVGEPVVVQQAWTTWRRQIAYTDAYVASAEDLGRVGVEGDHLRGVLAPLIEGDHLRGVLAHLIEGDHLRDVLAPVIEGDHLRGVLAHLIEEYARHNGHADPLRERIDGRVGQ